jgi:predicted membrane-bound spermidine synthase
MSGFRAACLATLMSGVACMFYQLAWVRELAGVTTAATIALVLVLAAFMAGLGIGAWLGGRLASRTTRPLRAYAVIEGGAAGMFLLGIPALAASLRLQQVLIDHGVSGPRALELQLVAVGIYLIAATTLLGMALPLLVAGLERGADTVARIRHDAAYNAIYGLNTAGALIGCLLCGYVTIESFGLHRSILLGLACSLTSALAALAIGERQATAPAPAPPPAAPTAEAARLDRRVAIAVCAVGAIALAAEVVWVRMFALVILNTVYAATEVLASVLLGIALAGFASARIARRRLHAGDPQRLIRTVVYALALAAIWTSAVPWLIHAIAAGAGLAGPAASGHSLKAIVLLAAILVPSSALLAVALPLLIAATARADATQALARLFALNTLGAVAGALAAGLWLLPWLGLGGAQLALALAIVGAAAILPGHARTRALALGGAAATAIALHLAIDLPGDLYALRFEHHERILELTEGVTSDVMVTEDALHRRRIWINSSWVAGTGGGHALLGHLPAIGLDHLDRAMGIALGTGQTFGAVLEHGAAQLDCVEINPDVVALSRRWFAPFNHGLFDNPGVHIHLEDGRAFLRSTRDRYDLIVLEPLQAWSAGTTALYTREFYEDAKRVLRPGGVVAQWIPFYGQDVDATRAMVKTAIDVFPQASLWLDEHDGMLLLDQDTLVVPWPALARELGAPADAALLAQEHLDAGPDLLSLFLMGPAGLAKWTAGAATIDDDRPFLEYAAARELGEDPFPAILGSTLPTLEDPGAYLPATVRSPDILRQAEAARDATIVRQLCAPADEDACAAELEADLAAAPSSVRVHFEYRELILGWAAGAPARREPIYRRAIAHDPELGEAMINLAVFLAERGQVADASGLATRALAIPRTHAAAAQLLARLPRPQ